ncbi:hypothetical protein [Hyphomonas sp.]|uniref:hypothetical protein n=1 Tax=Hyphomonas sp. TaxID=87 RepID=UPI002605A280|nr:hypothetical protein [Hyphomonas sp.]MDF1805269.1 hypothetical protein [Hyphomonas sp.]
MKGVVVSIVPALRQTEGGDVQLVRVRVGLGQPVTVGVAKGKFKVGQEIDLPYEFLGRDGESILIGMAAELYKHGKSNLQQVAGPEAEDFRVHPIDYSVVADASPIASGYLTKIWHEMTRLGYFDVRPDFCFYHLKEPSEPNDAQALVSLGVLIAEYQWRVEHESAAQAEYAARQNRLRGAQAAAALRKAGGEDTVEVVHQCASVVLANQPELYRNNSRLAGAVLNYIQLNRDEGMEFDGFDASHQWVRKIVSKLKRQGRLS